MIQSLMAQSMVGFSCIKVGFKGSMKSEIRSLVPP